MKKAGEPIGKKYSYIIAIHRSNLIDSLLYMVTTLRPCVA